MDRAKALVEIALRADALRLRGVASAYLFGSTARDEATNDSDLDIFVDITPGRKFSLIDLAGVELYLRDELGIDVDMTTRDSLHPKLRPQIELEALRVF